VETALVVNENERLGMHGGLATGDYKKRHGVENGMTKVDLQRYQTWKSIHTRFDVFLKLLDILHKRRLARAPKPWLREQDVPKNAGIPDEEQATVVDLMCKTKFGHPDRYMDRVSQEILRAMRQDKKRQPSRSAWHCGSSQAHGDWRKNL
jgi:hypothetical protein